MQVSGFMMFIPFLLMVGSITLLVMFVMAHRKMAQAHVEISEHLKTIASKMKAD